MTIPQLKHIDASILRAKIESNLSSDWTIDFTIFIQYTNGMVLYSVDYYNRLLMKLESESVLCYFNTYSSVIQFKDLCACSKCENVWIHFVISRQSGNVKFYADCLKGRIESRAVNFSDNGFWDVYPFPQETTGNKNEIQIWMVNYDTHTYKGLVRYPVKGDLKGCLERFRYNNVSITLNGKSDSFHSSCQDRCSPNICNKGTCLSRSANFTVCNCSNTAMNGPFCDTALREYDSQIEESYLVLTQNANIKLSWQNDKSTEYCLMELRNEQNLTILIHVNENSLKIDNKTLMKISSGTAYFLNILLSEKYITIQINGSQYKEELEPRIFIDIGFSKNEQCPIFDGKYDFHFNISQLIPSGNFNLTLFNLKGLHQASNTTNPENLNIIQKIMKFVYSPKGFAVQFIAVCSVGFTVTLLFITLNFLFRHRKAPKKRNSNQSEYLRESDIYMTPKKRESGEIDYDTLDFIEDQESTYSEIGLYGLRRSENSSITYDLPNPPIAEEIYVKF